MKRTIANDQTCVGELRLAAIDIGYDLRAAGDTVVLPAEFSSVGLDADGERWLVEGTRDELVLAIKGAGYKVRSAAK